MDAELDGLRRHITLLPDDDLLAIVTTDRPHYRQAAVDIAAKELARRNIPFRLTTDDKTAPQGGRRAASLDDTGAEGNDWLGAGIITFCLAVLFFAYLNIRYGLFEFLKNDVVRWLFTGGLVLILERLGRMWRQQRNRRKGLKG